MSQKTQSVANITKQALDSMPLVKYCVHQGVVNYSALADKIAAEHNVSNIEAVKVALHRYARQLSERSAPFLSEVASVVAASTLELKSDLVVAALSPLVFHDNFIFKKPPRFFRFAGSKDFVTVVLDQTAFDSIRVKTEFLNFQVGVSAVVVVCPRDVSVVPGVVHTLTQVLFEKGVNILDLFFSGQDMVVVFSRSEALTAFKALDDFIQKNRV